MVSRKLPFFLSFLILLMLISHIIIHFPRNHLKPCSFSISIPKLFISFYFIFFLFFHGGFQFLLQHHRLRETFLAFLLNFCFPFHHIPNIGFCPKLAISIKPVIQTYNPPKKIKACNSEI